MFWALSERKTWCYYKWKKLNHLFKRSLQQVNFILVSYLWYSRSSILKYRFFQGKTLFSAIISPKNVRCSVFSSRNIIRKGCIVRTFHTLPVGLRYTFLKTIMLLLIQKGRLIKTGFMTWLAMLGNWHTKRAAVGLMYADSVF
ncbi:hypothetical protein L21SP3_01933 [Sedimentisphaera cyanobacteriorum]|uniref:Uncharacterized protein n=1 Tax=Sedimentisphaera cyanobacteriorum TaxID=1940790 RepID=A0A1Q2HRM8_9BACT|nr:hypothetical protein L21SP3_01933 [Sedimentisphaera cyanobacteriorum]